jgi:hypothetical protein
MNTAGLYLSIHSISMSSLREIIEAAYRPILDRLADDLRTIHPSVRFHVASDAVGTSTTHQGWSLYIGALFADRAHDEADSVVLSIGLCHLDRRPRMMADVCWDWPSGYCEALLRDWEGTSADWPELDDALLGELAAEFPRLVSVFIRAVERGRPAGFGA